MAPESSATIGERQAESIPSQLFRDSMARLAAAVSIVTSDGPAGRVGFTATAVCSVSDRPPTLLVCVNRFGSAYQALIENGVLAVNVLTANQRPLSELFGGKTAMAQRFAGAEWRSGLTGAPILAAAAASLDCRIAQSFDSGTHRILLCSVVGVDIRPNASGLVYFDRRYCEMPTS